MNPIKGLLRSRKFLLLLLDAFVSLLLYFIGKYAPAAIEDVKFSVLVIQPVFVAIIIAIAWEDSAQKGATVRYVREGADEASDCCE